MEHDIYLHARVARRAPRISGETRRELRLVVDARVRARPAAKTAVLPAASGDEARTVLAAWSVSWAALCEQSATGELAEGALDECAMCMGALSPPETHLGGAPDAVRIPSVRLVRGMFSIPQTQSKLNTLPVTQSSRVGDARSRQSEATAVLRSRHGRGGPAGPGVARARGAPCAVGVARGPSALPGNRNKSTAG